MSGFGRTEKIIFGCAVAILMAFSYFLYDDSLLVTKTTNSKLKLIGNVSISQNDVRRKNLDTFSWIPAIEKDQIFQNDSIFTGDRSEALIHLQDGTQIKIQPNSMVTLNQKNGQMNLNLRYGNLVSEIAKNTSLTIKSGTQEFKLEGKINSTGKSKVQFKKSHSGSMDLKLISGEVKYINKKKNTQKDLPQNDKVIVSKNGEIKTSEKPLISLKTPDNINLVRTSPEDPLPFEWICKGHVARYKIEFSNSDTFNMAALIKTTYYTKVEIVDPLKSGSYFWRVIALDNDGDILASSPAQTIHITELESPQITSPVKEAQIKLEINAKGLDVLTASTEMRWTASSQFKNFIWQIAHDSQFKSILKEGETKNLSTLTPKLPSGTYWVRVHGKTERQKTSRWSEAIPFTLNLLARKSAPPSKPILLTKTVTFKAPNSLRRNPSSTESPILAWKPVLEVKNYHLQISKDIQFKTVEKYDVSANRIAWSRYRPGKYFYRVYARGLNELISEPSETGTLDISVGDLTLAPIKPIDIIAAQPSPKETAVSWNQVAFAKRYLLQMDKDKDFLQPAQFEYSLNKGTLTLPDPGHYYLRVQALDATNKPLTKFSNIEQAVYTFKMPLNTPPLLEPFNEASIFLQTEMEPFIWLEWKKVDRATLYTIEISDKADFSNLLITKSLKENRYLIKDKVPLGKIFWRVKAISESTSETSLWTDVREFTLYHQKNESFIK